MTLIFAHRGAKGTHPENTMIAFKEAQRVHADGIELDVRLTKDGHVVIIHDETIDRTTNGKGFVHEMTLQELKRFDASSTFKKSKEKVDIPTLDEFLQWFKKNNLLCNIEFKTRHLKEHELIEKTISLVRKYKVQEQIIFSSFNHYAIVYAYRMAPEIEIAPLIRDPIFNPWIYADAIHAKGFHPHYKSISSELINAAQSYGIQVRPYTINNDEDMLRLFELEVSAIITDFPDKAKRLYHQVSN